MTLKEYIRKLQKLVKEEPDSANYTVVFERSPDSFDELNFDPTIGSFGGDTFLADDGTEEFFEEYQNNSVSIN
jgi:hypothetical protein